MIMSFEPFGRMRRALRGPANDSGGALASYLLCYDLRDADSYAPAWQLLESWGAVPLLDSVWAVASVASALDLRDALKAVIGPEDKIAVIEVREGCWWACENAAREGLAWMRDRIHA